MFSDWRIRLEGDIPKLCCELFRRAMASDAKKVRLQFAVSVASNLDSHPAFAVDHSTVIHLLEEIALADRERIAPYVQGINKGKPEGRLVLNKMRTRDTISQEIRDDAPKLGLNVAKNVIRDLQAYRDAAQQGTVVTRLGRKGAQAAADMEALFKELVGKEVSNQRRKKVGNG